VSPHLKSQQVSSGECENCASTTVRGHALRRIFYLFLYGEITHGAFPNIWRRRTTVTSLHFFFFWIIDFQIFNLSLVGGLQGNLFHSNISTFSCTPISGYLLFFLQFKEVCQEIPIFYISPVRASLHSANIAPTSNAYTFPVWNSENYGFQI
jgi:hypothetical protein